MSRFKIDQITVLVVEPLKKPYKLTIDHTLWEFQRLVGGTISVTYPWEDPVGLIYNDNGIAERLPLNRLITTDFGIFGTFLICGLTEDNFGSLSEELAEKFLAMFRYPEMFVNVNGEIVRLILPNELDAMDGEIKGEDFE